MDLRMVIEIENLYIQPNLLLNRAWHNSTVGLAAAKFVLLEVWLMLQLRNDPSSFLIEFWDPDCSWQINTSGMLCPLGKSKIQQDNMLATHWLANKPTNKKYIHFFIHIHLTNIELEHISHTPIHCQKLVVKVQRSTYSFYSAVQS